MLRTQLQLPELVKATDEIMNKIHRLLDKKGWGVFQSKHEALGVITEEYHELVEAIHTTDLNEQGDKHIREELEDIAVACIVAIASLKHMDW